MVFRGTGLFFPGYCFIRIERQWHDVCQCPGVLLLMFKAQRQVRLRRDAVELV